MGFGNVLRVRDGRTPSGAGHEVGPFRAGQRLIRREGRSPFREGTPLGGHRAEAGVRDPYRGARTMRKPTKWMPLAGGIMKRLDAPP